LDVRQVDRRAGAIGVLTREHLEHQRLRGRRDVLDVDGQRAIDQAIATGRCHRGRRGRRQKQPAHFGREPIARSRSDLAFRFVLPLFLAVIAATSLPRGDTVFVEVDVALSRATSLPLEALIANQKSTKEVKLAPYVEVLAVSGKSARISYALRAASDAAFGTYRLFAFIEVRERNGAIIGAAQVDQTIEVGPLSPDIEAWKKSYLLHQGAASEAYEALRSLKDTLRLDRVDPPPASSKVKDADAPVLAKFLHHRLRADVELRRLRTMVDSTDSVVAEAALMAIGALSKRPTGTVAKASAIEGETIGRSLELALVAMNDARLDDAEAYLDKLTTSGRLDRLELASGLVMLGAIYAARGRSVDAEKAIGRALCIDPKLDIRFERPLFVKSLEAAKTARFACKAPIAIGEVTATRVEGTTILIRAAFGPDPYQLIGGGDVEVWGSGGGVHRAEKVRAHDNVLEATVVDTNDLQAYGGQLLLRVILRDVSGVSIATFGDPDPGSVVVRGESSSLKLDVPWWVWVVAGGVVAAAAGTTIAVVTSDRDVRYGIGPINAQF
jgi:hypothetical protein